MGFLTPVLLYNDSIHELPEDPHFPRRLYSAVMSGKDEDVFVRSYRPTWFDKLLKVFGLYRMPKEHEWQGTSSFAQVLRSKHADDARVLVVYGNTWFDISDHAYLEDSALTRIGERPLSKDILKPLVSIVDRDLKVLKHKLKDATK